MKKILLFFSFIIILLFSNISFASTTIQLQDADTENDADTFVNELSSTTNYGNDGYLSVDEKTVTNKRTFLRFNISAVPDVIIISNFTICLYDYTYYDTGSNDTTRYDMHKVDNITWGETDITWDDQPSYNTTIMSNLSFYYKTKDVWRCWEVNTDVDSWLNSTDLSNDLISFMIKDQTEVDSTAYYHRYVSKENSTASLRPYMNITYSDNTEPTYTYTDTSPSIMTSP